MPTPVDSKAICFDHTNGIISTNEDKVVSFGEPIIIGDGENFPENDENPLEDGLLKVARNPETNSIQLYQTDRNGHWQVLGEPYDESIEMIFALIMSS